MLCSVFLIPVHVYANTEFDAVIQVEGEKKIETNSEIIQLQVDVEFLDERLINKNLKLSYHIYNKRGELLLFEGERIALNAFNNNKVQNIPVVINLDSINEISEKTEVEIIFDIVDENNLYWFSLNPNIKLSTAEIEYDNALSRRAKKVANEIIQHPIYLVINLFIYVAIVYGIIYYRKTF